MPEVLSPEVTRAFLEERLGLLKQLPTFGEPDEEMYSSYSMARKFAMAHSHKTNRGKREIAIDLDMNVPELEALFIGQSVLDIGCGQGKFSNEIARLKKTTVTALDQDAEVMAGLQETKHLRKIQGSGSNVQDVLGDEQFDIVLSAYSSLHWATDGDEKVGAITSALRATRVGGKTIFIPVSADIDHREANRRGLKVGIIRGYNGTATKDQIEANRDVVKVTDWLEVLALATLFEKEESGQIDCTFVSSRDNSRGIPIANRLSGPNDPRQERYSAIVDVLSEV